MKDLPRVYANPINKEFNNYQTHTKSKDMPLRSNKNLSMKIKDIFNSRNYIYKKRVRITTENNVQEKTICGKTDRYLLTTTKEQIKLSDIIDIEVI